MSRARINSQKGFTLIEMLLVLALITVALLPLLSALSGTLIASSDNESTTIASGIAQAKMEEIQNTAYDNIVSSSKSPVPNYPAYMQEVQVAEPQVNLKDVNINIYWKTSSGSEKSFNLETLIVR